MTKDPQEVQLAPARITFTSSPVPGWQPSWESLVPTVEVAGRALIEACTAPPAPSDPAVLDQLALQAVGAAHAVAADGAVGGSERASAVADARRVVEALAEAHEQAEARRSRWLSSVARVVGLLLVGLAVARTRTSP